MERETTNHGLQKKSNSEQTKNKKLTFDVKATKHQKNATNIIE